jgi:hypothetical protein
MVAELAALANLAVDIEPAVGTKGAEVVQHLHDGDAQGVQRVVEGRRDQGINVVHEGDIGLELSRGLSQIANGAAGIDRFREEVGLLQNAVVLDLIIMTSPEQHFFAALFQ